MILEKRRLTMYRATRKVDDNTTQSRWFISRHNAYRWLARGFVFRIRGESRDTCPECEALADVGRGSCMWHSDEWFYKRVNRIARLIRHYDEKWIAP